MDVRLRDLHFRQIFVCKYGLPPITIIHCYHGNKNVATSKKGTFVHSPGVPNCMQNLKGG